MIANKIHCPKCGKLFFSSVTACDIEKRLSRVSDACPNCNPEAMPQKEEGQMYVVRNKLDKNIFINCDGNYSEGEGPDVILPNLSCADMLRSLGPNPEAWEVVEVTLIDKNPGEDGWYSVRDMEFAFNGGKILCAVMMNFGVERTFDEWLAEWLQVGGFPHRAKSEPKKKSLEQDIVAILNILPRRVVNSLKKKGIEDGD